MKAENQPTQAHFGIKRGEAGTHLGWTVTPIARSIGILFPGSSGVMVWNRPIAVEVRSAAGDVSMLRIHDVTRWMQLAAMLCGALVACLIWLAFQVRRESHD